MRKLTISDIHIGLNIITSDGLYGFISECDNPYEIKISLKEGGYHYCSIVEDSEDYEILFINL